MQEVLSKALAHVADRLGTVGAVWMVGGSCGLLLQGVRLDRPPRDLDVYADRIDLQRLYAEMEAEATDRPTYSETPIYASELVHFAVAGMAVELVGGFRVQAKGCFYEVSMERLLPHASESSVDGRTIRLMPLAHELIFNWLRERPDRYEPIAERMRQLGGCQEEALRSLLKSGQFPPEAWKRILGLLGAK